MTISLYIIQQKINSLSKKLDIKTKINICNIQNKSKLGDVQIFSSMFVAQLDEVDKLTELEKLINIQLDSSIKIQLIKGSTINRTILYLCQITIGGKLDDSSKDN